MYSYAHIQNPLLSQYINQTLIFLLISAIWYNRLIVRRVGFSYQNNKEHYSKAYISKTEMDAFKWK